MRLDLRPLGLKLSPLVRALNPLRLELRLTLPVQIWLRLRLTSLKMRKLKA